MRSDSRGQPPWPAVPRGHPPEAPAPAPEADELFVGSVAKAMRILYAFGEGRPALGLTEIARAAGMTVSTAQRFVHTLHCLGYLRKDAQTRRYRPGVKLLDFSFLYQRSNALTEIAIHDLVALGERTDETVNMVERDGSDIVFIARLPRHEVRLASGIIGTRLPAWCTASGHAILAALPEDEAARLIEGASRSPLTPATTTDAAAILASLREVRKHGYALIEGQVLSGETGVAAAILDYTGAPVAGVGIAVPTRRYPQERARKRLAPLVVDTAQAISRTLGSLGAFLGT